MTVMLRYNAVIRTFVLKVIATLANTERTLCGPVTYQAPQAITDRTVSGTWIGKNHWHDTGAGGAYFNGDMAGVLVVDEYLSTDATSAIADAMVRGEDLTTQGPCAPQVLSSLLPVVLSSADLCPPNCRSLTLSRCYSCSNFLVMLGGT